MRSTVSTYSMRMSIGRRSMLARLAAATTLAAMPMASVDAAPRADLWKHWTAHQPAAKTTVDHGAWDRLLKKHLIVRSGRANLVRYGRFTDADKTALAGYITKLENTPISRYNRREQLAYWINLYNALTVKVILDHYPVRSIRDIDISPGLFADGPWGKKLLRIEGHAVSLDDIEHRILRPIWRDPRIHYAVNCASIGCPDLFPEAVTAANSDAYLTRGAREYINDPRGATVEDGRLTVSSIYKWFREDFGGTEAAVIAHLKRYARPGLAVSLKGVSSVSNDRYDWTLNDAAPNG